MTDYTTGQHRPRFLLRLFFGISALLRVDYRLTGSYYFGNDSERAGLVWNDQYRQCMVCCATAREKRGREDKSAQMYSPFSVEISSPGQDELRACQSL